VIRLVHSIWKSIAECLLEDCGCPDSSGVCGLGRSVELVGLTYCLFAVWGQLSASFASVNEVILCSLIGSLEVVGRSSSGLRLWSLANLL
jgi:hypothetical protein